MSPYDDEAARRRVCLKHALRRAGLTWPSAATTDEDWLRAIAESHGVTPLTWSEIKQRHEVRP